MRRLAVGGTVVGILLMAVPLAMWLARPGPVAAPAPLPATPVTVLATPRADQAPPARITLPTLGVAVPVVPVGVDDGGEMEVPRDVRTVGWYRFGPAPGDRSGSAVLSGHVDDRVQGRGAFFDLGRLAVGDAVEVVDARGRTLRYRVAEVMRIPKQVLPVDTLFDRAGPPHLTLVTCGGSFDRATRNYRDNVVVTATPADG